MRQMSNIDYASDDDVVEKLCWAGLSIIMAACEIEEAHEYLSTSEAEPTFITASLEVDTSNKQFSDFILRPSTLGQMYWFCEMITKAKQDTPDASLVICTGSNRHIITMCALLIGCYMILWEDASMDAVLASFDPISSQFMSFQHDLNDDDRNSTSSDETFSISDCWHAIHRAKNLGWVDFVNKNVDIDRCIDMEEHFHYDQNINGNLHVVVPSKIIAFSCPSDIPQQMSPQPTLQWFDVGSVRRFTATYYADVFSDFDVKLVVSCSKSDYDTHGLRTSRISFERVYLSADSHHHLLQATDRFLTLTDLVPGAIAIHGEGDSLGAAELLISAYLIKRHAFAASHAMAWVRMVHPGRRIPVLRFCTHDRPQAASRAATIKGSGRGKKKGSGRRLLDMRRSISFMDLPEGMRLDEIKLDSDDLPPARPGPGPWAQGHAASAPTTPLLTRMGVSASSPDLCDAAEL